MNSATDYLLIDVSNSFTKIAFATRQKLGRTRRVPTSTLTGTVLRKLLRERSVAEVVVSSVVPAKSSMITGAAGRTPVLFLNSKAKLGVKVEYPKPASIGADRLANAAAVAELYGCPAIVVDFGTAVTFDVISADGAYIGGVIAAGLEAMTTYLYQRTALLPRLTLREPPSAVGKSTRGAMLAGAVFGYRGLIQEILTRITQEAFPRRQVHVVATGGYAKLIAAKLPSIGTVHPHLTLEGLRIVGNLNR